MGEVLQKNSKVQLVADGCSKFAADLHTELSSICEKNLIYSPFSLTAVLAMIKVGARGKTSDEMEKVLRYPRKDKDLLDGYSSILESFKGPHEGFVLAAANRVYSKKGFSMKEEFLNQLKNDLNAEMELLDLSNADESAQKINTWVESVTHNKIKDLISPDSLTPLTCLVLVNGIYFKGQWKEQFDPKETTQSKFHLSASESKNVDMMNLETKIPFVKLPKVDATAVALPYKGDRLQMIIMRPNEITGISKIENNLNTLIPSSLLSLLSNKKYFEKVAVSLPKFKIECKHGLVPILEKMGLSTMFGESADFSGIPTGNEKLYVSQIVQKAFVEVNEEGSEAAAATGAVMAMFSMPVISEFNVDRPFVFQIVDTYTNLVLFSGTVKDPSLN